MVTLEIKPNPKLILRFMTCGTGVALFVGVMIYVSDRNTDNILLVPSILFLMTTGILSIILLPYLLFERIIIKDAKLIHHSGNPFSNSEKILNISQMEVIYETLETIRIPGKGRHYTPMINIKTTSEHLKLPFKRFKEEDIKELIETLLRKNPNIKNEFDRIEIK